MQRGFVQIPILLIAIIVGTLVFGAGSYFVVQETKNSPQNDSQELPGLPPDPGEAGKATLEGVDSDGDGVRDDIERYIAFNHADSERIRKALTSYSLGMQAALLSEGNRDQAFAAVEQGNRAVDCLLYLKGEQAPEIRKALRAEYLNTYERSGAYRQYNSLLSGTEFTLVTEDERKARCDFNPDELPN